MFLVQLFGVIALVLTVLAVLAAVAAVVQTLRRGLNKAFGLVLAAPVLYLASYLAIAEAMVQMYRHFGHVQTFQAELRAVADDPVAQGLLPVALLAFSLALAIAAFRRSRLGASTTQVEN